MENVSNISKSVREVWTKSEALITEKYTGTDDCEQFLRVDDALNIVIRLENALKDVEDLCRGKDTPSRIHDILDRVQKEIYGID